MNTNKIRVALHMHSMSIPDKIIKAKLVKANLLANAAIFTGATALITAFTNAITALETATNNAGDGGKTLTALKHQRENEFDLVMQQVANYVENTANGNPATIILAGLDVAQAPQGRPVASFSAKQGESGTVLLRTQAEKGAAYVWQYSSDNLNWTHAGSSTKSSFLVEGLSRGTHYWFRVALIDKDGQHPFSEEVDLIVV